MTLKETDLHIKKTGKNFQGIIFVDYHLLALPVTFEIIEKYLCFYHFRIEVAVHNGFSIKLLLDYLQFKKLSNLKINM